MPLKIKKNDLEDIVEYEIDHKLLTKVENLNNNGYKKQQQNIMAWLNDKGYADSEAKIEKLKKHILVKHDKPSNCYTYERLLEDLHN